MKHCAQHARPPPPGVRCTASNAWGKREGLGASPAQCPASAYCSLLPCVCCAVPLHRQGWNLRRLDTTLSTVLKDAGFTLPGVNAPYLYFGMWRSTFAW